MKSKSTNLETGQSLATSDKNQLQQQLAQSRAATLALFEGVDAKTFCYQAHPDFSPVGWHLGHIGFIEAHWLLERSCGLPPLVPEYRRLFVADGLPKAQRTNLPTLKATCEYLNAIRQQVLLYLKEAPLVQQEWLWRWIIQHEAQHAETITWILQLQRQRSPWLGQLNSVDSQQFSRDRSKAEPTEAEMVLVEAGYSEQGNNSVEALDNEKSIHPVYLNAYWIDRYPVTRGQYQVFIDAGGYNDPAWWSSAGWTWLQANPVSRPLYWDITGENHPVYGVSWYEAEAYAHFVGKRLPSEAEWEKAASWNPGQSQRQTYSWGEAEPTVQHCNHSHSKGQTTPVNYYPAQSPYGCYDMLGNVWEWTATWFHPYQGFASYPYAGYSMPYFDNQHRVLKGGSWATRSTVLRCAFRNWYHPGVRQHFAGFRCARSWSAFPDSSSI